MKLYKKFSELKSKMSSEAQQKANNMAQQFLADLASPTITCKRVIAENLFIQHVGQKSRAEILQLMVDTAGLTSAGAATYYQNFKKKFKK